MHLEVLSLVYLFRKPSHPQLEAFIGHMSKFGSETKMDSALSSMPRYPSHLLCEMGELTQTGEYIQLFYFHLWQKYQYAKRLFSSLWPLVQCLQMILLGDIMVHSRRVTSNNSLERWQIHFLNHHNKTQL